MIPLCKQYWRDVQTWCRVWNHIDTNLITKQSIIINILFNYIKRLFFYYLRYPHDIRMKYCGFGCGRGCQNSCGYLRMRIRMRSSDTPLIIIIHNNHIMMLMDNISAYRRYRKNGFPIRNHLNFVFRKTY